MKSMKKLVTLLLSLVMLCALALPAMADEAKKYSITINGAVAGHTYTAYQVFSGVYYKDSRQNGTPADKKYLSDVEWGKDVDGTAIVKELQATTTLKKLRDKFDTVNADDTDAAKKVAYILQGLGDQSEELDEFARVVGHHLKAGEKSGFATIPAGDTTKTGTIPNLSAGYYFVKDSDEIGAGEIATKFLVEVVGDAKVTVKAQAPTIDKKIVDADNGDTNHTTANIGDKVEFKLTAKVPDMANFDTYTFTISDTLSKGLTFDAQSVVVNIDNVRLEATTNYKLTAPTNPEKDNTFKIEFTKKQLGDNVKHDTGATIVVTYKATLNSNALTTDKESNKATLEYSNNPAGEGTGTVKTPDVPVYICDFDIDIDKYDDTDNKDGGTANKEKKLAKAEFILYKEVTKNEQKTTYYYKWDNSTKEVKWVTDKQEATPKTTTADGKASFQGIAAGSYFLEETKAPDGYNKLKDPVPVIITADYDDKGQLTTSATHTGEGQYIQTVEVPNKAGAVLPSTGGIGTTIFYVLGSILALGAAVLLIVKKRMNGQDR
mgnify:CR=1 FL=1